MDHFYFGNYRGEINCGHQRFFFSCAELSDSIHIAKMYADIAINADNYTTRLDPANAGNFARTGGMFQIHTRESIEVEIKSGNSFFALLKDANGNIAASFWVSPHDPHFSDITALCPGGLSACESCECTIIDAHDNGAVVYPRELIVNAHYRIPGIAHAMFFTVFYIMRKNGYTHSLCEVYEVSHYVDGGEPVEIHMLNERSFGMTSRTGGTYIGMSAGFEIPVGPLMVSIIPRIFCFNYAALLPNLAREFIGLGMNILFYGDNQA